MLAYKTPSLDSSNSAPGFFLTDLRHHIMVLSYKIYGNFLCEVETNTQSQNRYLICI